jgi:hypothetical protein
VDQRKALPARRSRTPSGKMTSTHPISRHRHQQLRGEWWLAGDAQSEAVTVVSERLVFKPRLSPVT